MLPEQYRQETGQEQEPFRTGQKVATAFIRTKSIVLDYVQDIGNNVD
jgi:hypothetical protein